MAWSPLQGSFKLQWVPKTASTIFTVGALVDVVSGFITICTITRQSHTGVIQETVTAADSDYTSERRIPIQIPKSPSCEWKVSVLSTDTLAATDVGNFVDIGGSPVGIDITNATSADDAAVVTRFFGANSGAVHLNSAKMMAPGIGSAT